VQQEAHVVNYSWGQPAYEPTIDNYKTFLKLLQPMIVHMGASSQEEMAVLYARVLEEMQSEKFCGVGFFHRVWGQKPLQ
jgi:methionine salvage enolase-phosphatase E1